MAAQFNAIICQCQVQSELSNNVQLAGNAWLVLQLSQRDQPPPHMPVLSGHILLETSAPEVVLLRPQRFAAISEANSGHSILRGRHSLGTVRKGLSTTQL